MQCRSGLVSMTLVSVLEPSLVVTLADGTKADGDPLLAVMAETFGALHGVVPDSHVHWWFERLASQAADAVVVLEMVEVLTAFHRVPLAVRAHAAPAFAAVRPATSEAWRVKIRGEGELRLINDFLARETEVGARIHPRFLMIRCVVWIGNLVLIAVGTWTKDDVVCKRERVAARLGRSQGPLGDIVLRAAGVVIACVLGFTERSVRLINAHVELHRGNGVLARSSRPPPRQGTRSVVRVLLGLLSLEMAGLVAFNRLGTGLGWLAVASTIAAEVP